MTVGTEWKILLGFAIPIICGNLLQQLYNTVDGIVVGRLVNSNALAAVGTCSMLSRFFLAFSMGFSNGCGVIISQLYGAKKHEELRKAFSTGAIISLALGIALTAFGLLGHSWILSSLMNIRDEEVFAYADQYFVIYCLGLIFMYVYNYIAYSLRAFGDSRATLYFLALTSILNLILDMFMVKLWGIAGAAIATVISQIVCAVVSYFYMVRRYEVLNIRPSQMRVDREMMYQCVNLGIPAVLQQCSASLGNLVMQRLVNSFGSVTMAAFTVGSKVQGYVQAPIMGMQQAVATFTGQNMGAEKLERVKKGLYRAVIMNAVIVLAIGIVINLGAEGVAALFGVEGETLEQSVAYIRFMAPACELVFAVYFTCAGLIHGSGDVKYATFITLSSLVARAVFAYIAVYAFQAEYPILWRSALLANIWSLVFTWGRFYSGKWKKHSKAIVGTQEMEDGSEKKS